MITDCDQLRVRILLYNVLVVILGFHDTISVSYTDVIVYKMSTICYDINLLKDKNNV